MWEIAIKTSLNKLTLHDSFEEMIPEQLRLNKIEVLPISLDDLNVVTKIPFHHRDPFDRLIISQAMTRGIPIVSRDPAFHDYSVDVIWGSLAKDSTNPPDH